MTSCCMCVECIQEEGLAQKSAPPSLAASRESLVGVPSPRSTTPTHMHKRSARSCLTIEQFYYVNNIMKYINTVFSQ